VTPETNEHLDKAREYLVKARNLLDVLTLSEGGVARGIGGALNEEYIYDKSGRLDNAGFLDYRVPVASDMPMIEPILVEVPNPAHPHGAKGVGEVNIVPPMAAIANAIDSAIDRRLTELPMSPPKVRAALDHAGADD
jgi:CO/xanthine dehydrogenase Mo-binding subunit